MPRSSPSAEPRLAKAWHGRGPGASFLFPASLVFRLAAALRRNVYRLGLRQQVRLPIPVVVVGNITVGGSGKTPLVIHLAQALRLLGRQPGIISRGYGASAETPRAVPPDGDPALFGDEPVLLARATGCPVHVGRDRPATATHLLAEHPGCDVIISDDGLQHYALGRDLELAVFDRRGLMNGWSLPAGPLREPPSRLRLVDAIVLNETDGNFARDYGKPVFRMTLEGSRFHSLGQPVTECGASDLAGLRLHAVAGIAAPDRFFDRLRDLGLDFEAHPFPDHHSYAQTDLEYGGDAILTTEKDAVKLSHLNLSLPVWVLPVTAVLDLDLARFVLEKLNGRAPA